MIGDSLDKLTVGITDKFKQIDVRGIRVFKSDFIAFKGSDKIMHVGYVMRINEHSVSCIFIQKNNKKSTAVVPEKQFIVISELITEEERNKFNELLEEHKLEKATEKHIKTFTGVYHKKSGECGFINFNIEYTGKLSAEKYKEWKIQYKKLLDSADIFLINKQHEFIHIDIIKYSQILFSSEVYDTVFDTFLPVNTDTTIYDNKHSNTPWGEPSTRYLHLLIPIKYSYQKYGTKYNTADNEYFCSGSCWWPKIVCNDSTNRYINAWNTWIKQNEYNTKYLKGK